MSEEKEKTVQLIHNGEYVHDFLIDLLRYAHNLNEEDKANRMAELAEFVKKYPDEVDHSKESKSDLHNYLIEDVNYGVARGGMACGPVSGPVIVSVKFNNGEKSQYLNCSEFDGFPYFYLTDKDIFDYLMGEEDENEEMDKFLEDEYLSDFEDIELGDPEYYSIYKSIKESKDYNAAKLIRYVLNLVNLDYDATDALVEQSKGKHISDFFVSRNRTEVRFYDRFDEKEDVKNKSI